MKTELKLGPKQVSNKARIKRRASLELGYSEAQSLIRYPEFVAGCMLYWAEGTKHKNIIGFTNSNSHMMKFFIGFLKRFYKVDLNKIYVEIRSYTDSNERSKEIEAFWIDILGINKNTKILHYVNFDQRGGKKNRHTNGICQIRFGDTEKKSRLSGAIQYISGLKIDYSWVE